MKWLCLALIGLAQGVASTGLSAEAVTNAVSHRFKCELYSAQSGALFRSAGGNSSYNDLVHTVFVNSRGWVWVGTQNGLAIYDGNRWTSRTFKITGVSLVKRALYCLFNITERGPKHIVEGPPGTIWLDASWRVRDGRYEEIDSSSVGYVVDTAVDGTGSLWVVGKQALQKYDGRSWTKVLCPYPRKSDNIEARGLCGIAFDSNGNVWIGGSVYVEPTEPWEHEDPIWVVDQENRKRNDGPPTAPLFEFDGKRWRAFGDPHGLPAKKFDWAFPEADGQGRIMVKTHTGYFTRNGETWEPVANDHVLIGKQWVVRKSAQGGFSLRTELCFRDGERLLDVQPTDCKTGEVLDLRSDRFGSGDIVEDLARGCVWVGTSHGLYRIWPEKLER